MREFYRRTPRISIEHRLGPPASDPPVTPKMMRRQTPAQFGRADRNCIIVTAAGAWRVGALRYCYSASSSRHRGLDVRPHLQCIQHAIAVIARAQEPARFWLSGASEFNRRRSPPLAGDHRRPRTVRFRWIVISVSSASAPSVQRRMTARRRSPGRYLLALVDSPAVEQ